MYSNLINERIDVTDKRFKDFPKVINGEVYLGGNIKEGWETKPYETLEEIQERKTLIWKASREARVQNLEVAHNGVIYQADETSRSRMVCCIVSMDNITTQDWTAKDNTVHSLAKSDLIRIVKVGNIRQTEIWNKDRPSR